MPTIPKQYTDEFFPGLGDQHYIGIQGLGAEAIYCTINANTVKTSAQIVTAAPANGAGTLSYGPVVHSLGRTPSFAFAILNGRTNPNSEAYGISFACVTMDNSAVYIRARGHSCPIAAIPIKVLVIP